MSDLCKATDKAKLYNYRIIFYMLVKLFKNNPNPKTLDSVAKCLRDGGLIIYPTDTVYAIGCDIFQARAVEKICKIKGLDPRKANFSMVCSDISQISEYTKVDNNTFKLLRKNLPGAFTFILNCSSNLPKVLKNRTTIGIRVPQNDISKHIISTLGNPILSSSIPIDTDEPEYATHPELIYERYCDIVDMVIDGEIGETSLSTVVDCSKNTYEIVRQGKGELIE